MPKAVHQVTTKFNTPKRRFEVSFYLPCGDEALFQMTPLLSTYKKEAFPPSRITTHKSTRASQSKSKSISTPWA
jgi:hypothetical protein